jgi:chemotaxis signal transduction protein
MLPYVVGSRVFALPFEQVARVTMLTGVKALARYAGLPACVIGVSASDNEMVSVLDVGVLLNSVAVVHSLKTRLVVMSNGPMKGFALLVSRVLDPQPVEEVRANAEIQLFGADELLATLNAAARRDEGTK